jgi:putative oxidoreductase
MNNKKALGYIHAMLTIALALFFIYKGYEKFGPMKLREKNIKIENQAAIVQKIIVEKDYSAPYGYDLTMNTMRQSGFLKVIGVFQMLAGLLMLLPQTRMAGLLLLLPIILNIFLMHLFFDNRPHENIETGRYLAATILLLLYYWKRISATVWFKKPVLAA